MGQTNQTPLKIAFVLSIAVIAFMAFSIRAEALSVFAYPQGGTGTTTAPVSQLLYGGSTAYQSVATTTVTCSGSTSCTTFTTLGATPITITSSGGGGSGTVGTSSSETATYVPFWTTTSATPALLSGGSANFTWDNTNNRLGIGSTTPYGLLSVNPNAFGTAPAFVIGSSTATLLKLSTAGAFDVGTNTSQGLHLINNIYTAGNGLSVTTSAAGSAVTIAAVSAATDEKLVLTSKGAGGVDIGSASAGLVTVNSSTKYRLVLVGNVTDEYTTSYHDIEAAANNTNAAQFRFGFTGFADSALTAGTEAPSTYFNMGQTRQHTAGTIALQRDFRITGSTHSFSSASTLTTAAAFSVDGPDSGGTSATISSSTGIYLPTKALTNVTTGTSLYVEAPTGATNNYAAVFRNGNVGVGTSSPMSVLSVVGNEDHWGNYYHFGSASPNANCATIEASTNCMELVGNDNTVGGVGMYVVNTNNGASSYSGYNLLNSSVGNATTNYAGLYLNGPSYNDNTFGTANNIPNLAAIQNSMGPASIGSFAPTLAASYVNIVTASTTPGAGPSKASEVARFTPTGTGIGTTSPHAQLSVNANNTSTTKNVFELSVSGGAADNSTTTVLTVASSTVATLLLGTTTPANGSASATTTIYMQKLQFQGGNSAGTTVCMFVNVALAFSVQTGPCL